MANDNSSLSEQPRFFYHSFPRPRPEEARDSVIAKGIQILNALDQFGAVLAPEVVEWHTPVSIGSPSPTRVFQTRMSFTEIPQSEVPQHAKTFGPFSLEFDISDLRRIGALPVIYMPQSMTAADPLALIGAIVVSHLGHTKYTLEQLRTLSQASDPKEALRLPGAAGATSVNPDYVLNLRNVDANGGVVQQFEILAKTARELLQFIGFENAPFNSMIGALTITQSLFYPTDNQHLNVSLGIRIAGQDTIV